MTRKQLILLLIAVGLVVAATSAALNLSPLDWFTKNTAARPLAVLPPITPLPAGHTPNYRAIVQQAGPAVVGVTVVGLQKAGADEPAPNRNEPSLSFFRSLPGFQRSLPSLGQDGSVPFRSQGSGFLISSDGLILTNAHVVRHAREVMIKLSDRREFKARVLGADSATDMAVLRIDAKHLPAVRLGDSQQLQVGDPVLAIGSPFGFEQTVTQGIVSAKGRSLPGDTAVPFIQTDAAMNPGNSGGPLIDASGAVVGINALIYSQSGGSQGVSFAIPINVALKVKDQIVASGHAAHARLGVTVQDLNQPLAESFGLSHPDGALIAYVAPASAAASAGLMPGDAVTSFNGEPVHHAGDLSNCISLATPGETVHLMIWRNNSARTLAVKLGQAEQGASPPAPHAAERQAGQLLGLMLRPLTRNEQAQAHLQSGLLVEAVSGAAERAGLQPGDVLLALNGLPLKAIDQLRSALARKPKNVALLLMRHGEHIFIPVAPG